MTTNSLNNIPQYSNTVQCYFCSETFIENNFIEHLRLCGSVLEPCPKKCGAYIPRKNFNLHKRFCLKRVRFDENNLTNTKLRMEQVNNNDEIINWREHVISMLSVLKNSIKNGEHERNEIMENSYKTMKRLEEIEGATKNIRLTIFGDSEATRQRFISYDKHLKSLDNNIVDVDKNIRDSFENVAYRLDVIQGSIINEKNKQNIVSLKFENDIKELKNFVTKENQIISDIWNDYKKNINDLKLELEMRCKKQDEIDEKYDIISEKIDILVDELKKHSSCIIQQDKTTKTLKIQIKETIKCLEELAIKEEKTISFNNDLLKYECGQQQQIMMNGFTTSGRLLWRIDRYKEKMTAAKDNNESLLSPIFYNKEYGYALQMEMFLNGRDRWKDRNIIGCLKVVEGPWDPLLDWPCILRATVTLRDQNNPANNIRKIVKTKAKIKDNESNCSVTYDSAIDMFIPHTNLTRHDGFIKNNIIFIDIQVTELRSSCSTSSLICGIYVVYYLDYTIGGGWWIMMLYLVQVGAVFVVRGRPHTGDTVVAELFPPNSGCLRHWAGPLLSFTWNVIMPITLVVLGCTLFKFGGFRDLYVYKRMRGEYWAVWARQLGAAIQLIPILIIPAVAIIQTCRYLNNGPPDIFDRIQMLYRPNLDTEETRHGPARYGNPTSTSIHGNGILPTTSDIPFEDPPPKYTPPPSYTTATGARIAKMLRQSFRRSVRRIANVLGESSSVLPRSRPALQPPPPDYATVLVEINQSVLSNDTTIHTIDQQQQQQQQLRPDVTDTGTMTNVTIITDRHRPNTIDRMTRINTLDRCNIERTHSTMDRNRRYLSNGTSNLTAADVANLLRSSMRRGTSRTQQTIRNSIHNVPTAAASVENLVNGAAPINEDSLVIDKNLELVNEQNNDDKDDDEDKTVEMDNSVSVI